MEHTQALAILTALSNGIDPLSGEAFPADSPYQHPDVVRALFHALRLLEGREMQAQPGSAAAASNESREKPRASRPGAENAGRPWSPEEDEQLANAFDAGAPIEALAQAHGRSRLAIEARLAKLGRMPMPEGARFPFKPSAPKAAEAARLLYAASI